MRPVKNASVTKKPDTDAGAFRLRYFRAQYKKKGFDVIPADAAKALPGFAVLSTILFPLKGEVSNHKGIFDENRILFFDVISRIFPS